MSMAESQGNKDGTNPSTVPINPASLLSLYGMQYAGLADMAGLAAIVAASNNGHDSATASNAPTNNWYTMAAAAQLDYLSRIQSSSADTSAYAALAAQGIAPKFDSFSQENKSAKSARSGQKSSHVLDSLKLPSDTEIIKYTSSSTGPKVPGTTNRGRKKTISLDPTPSLVGASGTFGTAASFPSGLTIERKKPGRKSVSTVDSVPSVTIDKVEITKVPRSDSPSTSRNFASSAFNMASKPTTAATISREPSSYNSAPSEIFGGFVKEDIPSDYYASHALSGVFLAEQIRQQQLAAALQNRLSDSKATSSQAELFKAALLLNESNETSKLFSNKASNSGKNSRPKKNTVASLLAASKAKSRASADEEHQDVALQVMSNPELTIEPIYKSGSSNLRIKNVSDSPEIRNLEGGNNLGHVSDSGEEDDANGTISENGNSKVTAAVLLRQLRQPVQTDKINFSEVVPTDKSNSTAFPTSTSSASRACGGRYATVETAELRLPLKIGWRRETLVREYSKSGVRGDVVYYAPCGKKFKQYPDIVRYLEKNNIDTLSRGHFSFSTKIFIGEFLKPTGESDGKGGQEKYLRLGEKEMIEDVDRIRKENGWKPRKPAITPSTPSTSKSENTPMPSMTPEQKFLARLQAELQLREQLAAHQEEQKLQKEALKYLREAERLEKLEHARREREAEKRRRQEERAEEIQRKIQEKELKRQQSAIAREQERERRRQHANLMKQLEGKKRNDERDRKREEFRIEKEKERERKLEQKRLECEIVTEMRKPVEDMAIPVEEHKQMPELKRIPNIKLSGEAFANVLMIHEFLHNFGERLGFDMESLPTINDYQAALLFDSEAEEELLSVLIHLLVCAIDDPGIPFPHKHLTLLGQNLRQADITNTNVSEILKIYLRARAVIEVKNLHGVLPPDAHITRDKTVKDLPVCKEKMDEYHNLLHNTRAFQMSNWLEEKNFLCLNPTEKSELIAFVCNELLFNKAVMNEIEGTVEQGNKAKKIKVILENKLKKLKSIQLRKYKYLMAPKTNNDNGDTSTSKDPTIAEDEEEAGLSDAASDVQTESPKKSNGKKKKGRKPRTKGKKKKAEEQQNVDEDEEDEEKLSDEELEEFDDGEDDEKLGPEDLQKKIDKVAKRLLKQRDDVVFINNCLRVNDLGQDRHRRRYWHFAHSGGVFVEGMESCEPWKISNHGMPHIEKTKKESSDQGNEEEDEENNADDCNHDGSIKEEDSQEVNQKSAIKEAGVSADGQPSNTFSPKTTANGDKLNLFNHSAQFNMSLSPVVLNGAVTITPKVNQPHFLPTEPVPVSNAETCHDTEVSADKPWFSILPANNTSESAGHAARFETFRCESYASPEKAAALLQSVSPVNPQIALLEIKLEQLRKSSLCTKERRPIPKEMSRGWWRIVNPDDIVELERCLHIRGAREQLLLQNLKRSMDFCHPDSLTSVGMSTTARKPLGEDLELEPVVDDSDDEEIEMCPGGAPPLDVPGQWSRKVALRVDKYILEQVEALEDKVAAASMQVPGWKMQNKPDIDSRDFRPSCEAPADANDNREDAVAEARQRLLELEVAIERRYLKAPLGHSNTEVSLQTITSSSTSKSPYSGSTSRRTTNTSLNISKEISQQRQNESNDEESNSEDENDDKDDDDLNESGESLDENDKNEKQKNLPRGLIVWREGVKKAKTAAQLAMAFYVLETSIAWHKSIMKAFCQLCHSGDDEDSLLLCDGCDKGYHMYCFRPSMKTVPDGDWYCFECINKATGTRHCLVCGQQEGKNIVPCTSCPRAYHTDCLSPALSKVPRGRWQCPGCNQKGKPRKKLSKKLRIYVGSRENEENSPAAKNPEEDGPEHPENDKENGEDDENGRRTKSKRKKSVTNEEEASEPKKVKKEAKKKKHDKEKDLNPCVTILTEMESSEDCWPFLYPVNTKQFPTYKKIIKTPMDIASIKKKLESNAYKTRQEFCSDIKLMFQNCEVFNEDDSPVGKAGHAMKQLFDTRWMELIGENDVSMCK